MGHVDQPGTRTGAITPGLTLKRILYFRSSGLGRPTQPGRGAVTSFSPKTPRRIAPNLSCCSEEQCTSAEMMTGYGEVTKAYLLIAWQISLTGHFDVNVFL